MRLLTLTLLAVGSAAASAGTDISVDAETGLTTWQTETAGIQVRLTQISPDQARAFYLARGFSAAAAERYASECVFMTVVRNIGDVPIQHRLPTGAMNQLGNRRAPSAAKPRGSAAGSSRAFRGCAHRLHLGAASRHTDLLHRATGIRA